MLEPSSKPQDNLKDLEWLVENRSLNQKATLRIYSIVLNNKDKLANNQWRRSAAQKLLGIAFSLWRAVFLTDIKRTRGSMLNDVEGFLLELIQNNAITYVQDRKNRDWTFRYYIQNATDRLSALRKDFESKGRSFDLPGTSKGKNTQQRWAEHQSSLDEAISAYESILQGSKPAKAAPVRRAPRSTKSIQVQVDSN